MSLSPKIRHLVMNRTNQAIAPRDEMLAGYLPADLKAAGEIPKKYSPSFINESKAREFAQALALKYSGENFYVAKIVAGVTAASVQWADAVPVGSVDDATLAVDCDDDSPNE